MRVKTITRRHLSFALFLIGLYSFVGCAPESSPQKLVTLRIGFQKWGTCSLLKVRGTLESRLKDQGVKVEWTEFPSGPPLLEALNSGSIDIGHAGDSPPIFAQAAGVPFAYIAASTESPDSSAIVVRNDSAIKAATDLRGKRIGFVKGSSAHSLVVRALAKCDLSLSDVEVVYLAPSDARAALEGSSIDAWSIWDPYLAAAEHAGGLRTLIRGSGLVPGREFYFASQRLAEKHPEIAIVFLEELDQVKGWAKSRTREVSEILAVQIGMEVDAVEQAELRRGRYGTIEMTDEIIAEQQAFADGYFELGLLPERIEVHDAVRVLRKKPEPKKG
jgi:sulfonate transport system substrate-binding protein